MKTWLLRISGAPAPAGRRTDTTRGLPARDGMRRLLGAFLLLVAALAALPAAQAAERRVALVIGNAEYRNVPALKNPRNDADDVSAALKRLGFEVIDGRDATQAEMNRLFADFKNRLDAGADVGLFFFAGHGVQLDGVNYLVPVDASLENAGSLSFQTIDLQKVIGAIESPARTSLVFLDACRDNPIVASRSIGGVGRGLARVETGRGTYIAFATDPGKVALDGEGRNSPFTAALTKHIEVPDQSVADLMINVRNEVVEATGGKQTPWDQSSLRSQFYFKRSQEAGPATASKLGELLEDEAFVELLRKKLELDAPAGEPRTTPVAFAGAGADAGTTRPLPDAAPEGTTDPVKVAALPSGGDAGPADEAGAGIDESGGADTAREASPEVVRAIQEELARANCRPGVPDGAWGERSRRALARFAEDNGLGPDLAEGEPTADILAAIRAVEGGMCEPPTAAAPKKQARPPRARAVTAQEPESCPRSLVRNARGKCVAAAPKRPVPKKPKKPKKTVAPKEQPKKATVAKTKPRPVAKAKPKKPKAVARPKAPRRVVVEVATPRPQVERRRPGGLSIGIGIGGIGIGAGF